MQNYKKILVAVELIAKKEEFVINKAKELAGNGKTELYLVNAVEKLSSYVAAYGTSAGIDIEKEMLDEAKEKMSYVEEKLNVKKAHQIIKTGRASQVILDAAEKIKANLIIVGSHGHHGLRLLLGSTANAVIHGARCDVLAVNAQ